MRLFTSESVTPGHPDKLCDQISDAILDAYLRLDADAHVAVECFASAGGLVIGGEVSSLASVEHAEVAEAVLQRVGYSDYAALQVLDRVTAQSPEIAAAVAESLEERSAVESITGGFDPLDEQGAGDQGLMFGYAVEETTDLMPLPIALAHAVARALYEYSAAEDFTVLGPDGKTQVTVAYDDDGRPAYVDSVLVSTQHKVGIAASALEQIVTEDIVRPALGAFAIDPLRPGVLVNPSGSFIVGGPAADAGLTGRKIIVDTYGGMARHGGGAFSGKDPSKVDRSGAYAMRWVAKHVVAAGLARRCEVQVAYAIGQAHPVGLHVETFGTGAFSEARIESAIRQVFDLRPAAIIRDLDLRRPIYEETAVFGHFGGHARPWETLSPSRLALLQLLFPMT